MACVGALAAATPAGARDRLSAADRAAINATLDVLVNHAVKRKDVGRSYDVVTPVMRAGMTRAQWSRGSIPVYPYPAAGRRFHEWTVQYRTKDEIALELILAPNARNKKKLGQILFHVYLQPRRRPLARRFLHARCDVRPRRERRRSCRPQATSRRLPEGRPTTELVPIERAAPPLDQLGLHLHPVRWPRASPRWARGLGRSSARFATRDSLLPTGRICRRSARVSIAS